MSHTHAAKKCFNENIQLFSNPESEPEKYNLYNGLLNLTQAVEDLQSQVRKIEQDIERIRQNT